MVVIRDSARSFQQARQGELVGFQPIAEHLRKQNKGILRSIVLRIARNQGSPSDQILVRHLIEQVASIGLGSEMRRIRMRAGSRASRHGSSVQLQRRKKVAAGR
ncbi:hypothetical protein TB1_011935 [Malus domestica]